MLEPNFNFIDNWGDTNLEWIKANGDSRLLISWGPSSFPTYIKTWLKDDGFIEQTTGLVVSFEELVAWVNNA